MSKSTAHESKFTKSTTLDVQLEVLDGDPEIGKFDEQDGTWSTTTETGSKEESEMRDNNHNTFLSSTILMTLGLLQPSRYNVIWEIKYSEDGIRITRWLKDSVQLLFSSHLPLNMTLYSLGFMTGN